MQASGVMVCCKPVNSLLEQSICAIVLHFMCSVDSFQFHHCVQLVMSDLLMEAVRGRGGWRCAEVECGEQFMTIDGTSMMQKSYVGN